VIVSLIANIVGSQLAYTYTYRNLNGVLNHYDLAVMMLQACGFTSNTTFNLAYWLFAFSYLALSYRMELTAKKLPEDTHNCRLNTVNILVCLLNVIVTVIYWICDVKQDKKAAIIANDIE
jgi:hypothetical protein